MPSSGGMLSSWAVSTRDKVEAKALVAIPLSGGKRHPGEAIERSLWAKVSSYDRLPALPSRHAAATDKPQKPTMIHLPPLDPIRFPRLSTAMLPESPANELSAFTSPKQIAKARRAAALRAKQMSRKAELDAIARAAEVAVADEKAPARLKEVFKRWDANGGKAAPNQRLTCLLSCSVLCCLLAIFIRLLFK